MAFAQNPQQEQDCVKASLSILDKWEYDSRAELLDIISSCQNNLGKDCLLESITTLSTHENDDIMELTSINRSCPFVNADCLKVEKSFLRNNDQDDRNEIIQLNQICQYTDHLCLKNYCSIDPKNCDSYFDIREFAQFCRK